MTGLGHNRGPTMEPGGGWRRYAWRRARRELLPHMPLEVVRMRMRRARELGMDYPTYAAIRLRTGHDVTAFLFSSNALRLFPADPDLPPDRADKLAAIRGAVRVAVLQPPLDPRDWPGIDRSAPAPRGLAPPREVSRTLRAVLADAVPGDRVCVVGDTALERDWVTFARLAAYLPAARYFAPPAR